MPICDWFYYVSFTLLTLKCLQNVEKRCSSPGTSLNVCDTETHICRYTECKTRKHFQYGVHVAIHRSFSGLFGTTWPTHEKYQPDSESLAEALLELGVTCVSAVPLTRSLWPFNMGAEMKKQDIPSCTHVLLKPPVWDRLNVRINFYGLSPVCRVLDALLWLRSLFLYGVFPLSFY